MPEAYRIVKMKLKDMKTKKEKVDFVLIPPSPFTMESIAERKNKFGEKLLETVLHFHNRFIKEKKLEFLDAHKIPNMWHRDFHVEKHTGKIPSSDLDSFVKESTVENCGRKIVRPNWLEIKEKDDEGDLQQLEERVRKDLEEKKEFRDLSPTIVRKMRKREMIAEKRKKENPPEVARKKFLLYKLPDLVKKLRSYVQTFSFC